MNDHIALLVDGRPHASWVFFTAERGLDEIAAASARVPLRLTEALRRIEELHPELARIAVLAEAEALDVLARQHRGRCALVPLPWTPGGIHEDPERRARAPLAWGDSYSLLVLLLDGNASPIDLEIERLALGLTASRKIILEPVPPPSRPPRPDDGWSLFLRRSHAMGRRPRLRSLPLGAGRLMRRKLEGLAMPCLLGLLAATSALGLFAATLVAALARSLDGLFRPPLHPRPRTEAVVAEALAVLGPRPASVLPMALECLHLRNLGLPAPIRAAPSPFPADPALPFGRGPLFMDPDRLALPLHDEARRAGLLPSRRPRHRSRFLPHGFWSLVGEGGDWKELLEREPGDEALVLAVPGPAASPPDDLPGDLPADEGAWRALLAERGWSLERIVDFHRADGAASFRLLPLLNRFGADRTLGRLPPGALRRRILESCLEALVPAALEREIHGTATGPGRRRLVLARPAAHGCFRDSGSSGASPGSDGAGEGA